jgi:two-component system, NtrC family, sensor kinase
MVERHTGKLNFFSEPGQGTEFQIQLPVCRNFAEPLAVVQKG